MTQLTEAQQSLIGTLLILSVMYFIASIVCLMWAYFSFRGGFK